MVDDFQTAHWSYWGTVPRSTWTQPAHHRHTDALRSQTFSHKLRRHFRLEPGVSAVLRGVFARRVFVVPLFISEGYFTEEVLPRELGFAQREDGSFETTRNENSQTIHYCGPSARMRA